MPAATSSAPFSLISATRIAAPSSAMRCAHALPIPEAAPVMIATWFSSSIASISLLDGFPLEHCLLLGEEMRQFAALDELGLVSSQDLHTFTVIEEIHRNVHALEPDLRTAVVLVGCRVLEIQQHVILDVTDSTAFVHGVAQGG